MLDSYKKLQEKFGLPHLDILQNTFQFEIDDDVDLHDIRNEVSGKLFEFTERVIEPLIWSMHHCHVIERNMLTPKEERTTFELYKRIQALRWRNHLLTIRPDMEETAKWLADFWAFWKEFEAVAASLCTKFSRGWAGLNFRETVAEYQG